MPPSELKLYRICKPKYAATAFDGEGARLYGGRWNSPGTSVVYAAGSLSLAILEILVHLDDDAILPSYSYLQVDCPADLIANVSDIAALPPDWSASPAPAKLKEIGDDWARGKTSAVLMIPSAVVGIETNYLINPRHLDFARLSIGAPQSLSLDSRLIKK